MSIKHNQIPRLDRVEVTRVVAQGSWRVEMLVIPGVLRRLQETMDSLRNKPDVVWDLSEVDVLDYMGALFFWRGWGSVRPQHLILSARHENFFARIEQLSPLVCPAVEKKRELFLVRMGKWSSVVGDHVSYMVMLIGQLVIDIFRFLKKPHYGPWKEISANIFHAGSQALGITALVGFLIGVVLSYLSVQPLRVFGAEVFLVNLLGLGIVRELGPLLSAILVAGRSGSSITAQLGVMRVTEELDAMAVMGLPHGFRVILPKVIALAIVMPMLVLWTSMCALLGGMVSARLEAGLSMHYFISTLPSVVPVGSFLIGMGKGVLFGILIALIACHLGIRIRPNTESLGHNTTASVVTSITAVILMNALVAILFKNVGF